MSASVNWSWSDWSASDRCVEWLKKSETKDRRLYNCTVYSCAQVRSLCWLPLEHWSSGLLWSAEHDWSSLWDWFSWDDGFEPNGSSWSNRTLHSSIQGDWCARSSRGRDSTSPTLRPIQSLILSRQQQQQLQPAGGGNKSMFSSPSESLDELYKSAAISPKLTSSSDNGSSMSRLRNVARLGSFGWDSLPDILRRGVRLVSTGWANNGQQTNNIFLRVYVDARD